MTAGVSSNVTTAIPRAHPQLRRSVSGDDFCAFDLREHLRDIEVCLAANRAELFHMGLKNVPARSTLSDAFNLRDWRIYRDLAMRMITQSRSLYANERLDLDLDATVGARPACVLQWWCANRTWSDMS